MRHNRCCSGGLTYLDATTAKGALDGYEDVAHEEVTVQLFHRGVVLPSVVTVELKGKVKPRLVAYWDGCAYRL